MSISQDRGLQFEERLLNFSLLIIHLFRGVGTDRELPVIKDRLLRSATATGANHAEVNNAASQQDFRNKIFIAKNEAAETRYWLRLLQKTCGDVPDIAKVIRESSELLMILQKNHLHAQSHPLTREM